MAREVVYSTCKSCHGGCGVLLHVRDVVLVKTLVNSGITAPAMVPQLMITESTHQSEGCNPA